MEKALESRTEALQAVYSWLGDQYLLMAECDDPQEKQLLKQQYFSVYRNLGYCERSLERGDHYHFCTECGIIEFISYSRGRELAEKGLCFMCDFWKGVEAEHLKRPKIIVGGMAYSDGGNRPNAKKAYLGHAGRTFHIRLHSGEEWATNNLWGGGTIPLKYRLITMKDNAVFL